MISNALCWFQDIWILRLACKKVNEFVFDGTVRMVRYGWYGTDGTAGLRQASGGRWWGRPLGCQSATHNFVSSQGPFRRQFAIFQGQGRLEVVN